MSIKTGRITSLKKFTNIALFERREKNQLKLKNQKTMYPLKLYKNKNEPKEQDKTNIDFNHILFSFYSFQNDRNSTYKSYSKKRINNNTTIKSIFCQTSNNFEDTSFPFYITQTEPSLYVKSINCSNLKSRNKLIKKDKIKINNNVNYDDLIFAKNYKTYTNFNKYNKIKKDNFNKEEHLMNLKMNKLKSVYKENFFNTKTYIDKTRKLLKIKYSSSIKNERKKINEEVIDNQKEIVDDKIKSLKNVKFLYNQYFNYKLSEYIKFIFKKRELERKYDSALLNQIYSLKKEISHLMNKIKKVELEKYSIIQWFFFQIRVKEKKLVLPNYYIKILEANIKRNNNQRRTAQADIRIFNHPSKKAKSSLEKFNLLNKEQNNEITVSGINEEEAIRILQYKYNLIFETPDDFFDEIKKIENKNIKLFNQSDILNIEIKKLKEQYDKIMNEKLSYDLAIANKIKEKEIELEVTKKRYKNQLKIIIDYKNDRYKIKKNKNKKINTNSNLDEDNLEEVEILNPKKLKLYTTIEQLYLICQDIEIKNKEIFSLENQKFFIKKGNSTKEEEVLQMMEFIEVRISHLLNIFSIYKNPFNPNYELIRRLRNNFIRKRKIEKAGLTRIENNLNYNKLIKKIDDRNNKLIFLQRRKIDMNNYAAWSNEQKKEKIYRRKQAYLPTFEDFLFDNNTKDLI